MASESEQPTSPELEVEDPRDSQLRHLRWLGWTLFALIVITFIIVIIILRGLCTDVWYIRWLGLNDKLCSGSGVGTSPKNATQTLSIVGNEISISGGNTITLPITGPTGAEGSSGGAGTAGAAGTTGLIGPPGPPGPTEPCVRFGTYFCQGGNNFGTTAILGTNDPQELDFRTGGTLHASINPFGAAAFQNSANSTQGFKVQQASSSTVFDVDTTNSRVGINTLTPSTDLHVQGSERVTGHSAVGPDATLSDSMLVTPLPPPYSTLMARRTQYVAEKITDISTAPPYPGVYVAQGNELLLDPATDPSALLFGGAYSVVTTAPGNSEHFGQIVGQVDGVVLKGDGPIDAAFGTVSGVINLDGSVVTGAVGHLVGSTNADPAGIIATYYGVGVMPINNSGTVASATGLIIADQANSFAPGGIKPLTASNITTTGAAKNEFGGNTLLNAENSNALTNNITSPYDAATRWPTTASNDLPTTLKWTGYAYANGNIYVTGGYDGASAYSTVYYTKINADKTLSGWTATTPLPATRYGHRTFIENGYIYVVGGNSGGGAVSTVYYARLNADGSVGSWRTTTSLPAVREFFGGTQYNGYLYALAGTDGFVNTSTVYYAKPGSDGTISAWTTSATPLPSGWKQADAVVNNGTIYYLDAGGFSVRYATLNANGSNNAWSTASTSPTFGTFDHYAYVNSGILYRVGGILCGFLVCDSQATVSAAPILPTGDLGSWEEASSTMPTERSAMAGAITNGVVYVIGGEDMNSSVSTYKKNVYQTLTRRVEVAGALDLLSLSNSSESAYGGGVSLKAGSTEIVGGLSVFGDGLVNGHLAALQDVNFAANTQLGGGIIFDQEVAHSIKLANSTTAATAGASLSILGANGNGAAGGNLILDAGSGTTAGNILLNSSSLGNVGVQNAAPAFALHVGSGAIASGTIVARFENAGGTCDVTPNVVGAVTCTSDIRVKKNIVELTDSLEKVGAIKVYSYNLTAEQDTDPVHVGFLAQELESIMPDLVRTDSNGMKSVSYSGLTPYLVQALKQQQTQINELKSKLDTSSNGVSVDVVAELAKAKAITLNGNLVVNGRVEFSAENKATVKIPAGSLKLNVSFISSFGQKPNVVISPNDFVDGAYKTSNVTVNGFDIELNKAQSSDIEFNWQAF